MLERQAARLELASPVDDDPLKPFDFTSSPPELALDLARVGGEVPDEPDRAADEGEGGGDPDKRGQFAPGSFFAFPPFIARKLTTFATSAGIAESLTKTETRPAIMTSRP